MRNLFLTLSIVALFAAPAAAQVDVELAFDPASAAPGDMVTFYASVANLGDEAVAADLELMVSFGGFDIGPVTAQLPLAAGEELSLELPLVVPMVISGGDLVITVTATADGMSDSATATLSVTGNMVGNPSAGLAEIADQFATQLSSATTPAAIESVGSMKATW